MAQCTCTYSASRVQKNNSLDFAYILNRGVRIFTPGCPVHEPPADEDDPYSFEVMAAETQPPSKS